MGHTDQEWKHTCYVKCLAPVLDAISRPSIDYETVLDLDKGIRDLPIPPTLRSTERTTKALALQRASVSTSLEAGKKVSFYWLSIELTIYTSSSSATSPSVLHKSIEWT